MAAARAGSTAAPATLGRLGSLEVRLATDEARRQARAEAALQGFYKEASAIADAATLLARRDKDAFDAICDHLLVLDHAAKPTLSGKPPVVGTYRLLRQDVAERHGGFYTDERIRHRRR